MKPRWAVHGVEFLIISSGPTYTQHLSDEEFAAFKVRTSLLGDKIPCTYVLGPKLLLVMGCVKLGEKIAL